VYTDLGAEKKLFKHSKKPERKILKVDYYIEVTSRKKEKACKSTRSIIHRESVELSGEKPSQGKLQGVKVEEAENYEHGHAKQQRAGL
jgi:hypothetical protein